MDGEEDIAAGLGLQEFAEVLVQLGAWQAVVSQCGGCVGNLKWVWYYNC